MVRDLIDFIFQAIYLVLIIRIALSWIPHDRNHPIIEGIYKVSTPILKPFKDIIPPMGGIDISPIAAFFAIGFVKRALYYFIF